MKRRDFLKTVATATVGLRVWPRAALGQPETKTVSTIKTKFVGPRTVAVTADGDIYVGCSARFGGLEKFDRRLTSVWSVGQEQIRGIAFAPSGEVYATTVTGKQAIKVFTASGECRQTVGGPFDGVTGIAVNRRGEIYAVESSWWPKLGGHRVQQFDPTGKLLRQWGSVGTAPGQFNLPTGIALDHEQNVWVADSYNSRIQKFTPDGQFLTAWGAHGAEPGQLNCPQGIAVDSDGNLWVADTYNNRLQQFTPTGKLLRTLGRQGTAEGEFWLPCGIAVDATGTIYVADTMNNRVQVLR